MMSKLFALLVKLPRRRIAPTGRTYRDAFFNDLDVVENDQRRLRGPRDERRR